MSSCRKSGCGLIARHTLRLNGGSETPDHEPYRINPAILAIYAGAAAAEIAGCFAFWAWLRLGKPVWWIVPGMALLILFVWLLTRVDAAAAGRTYAAYGGIYIIGSLAWMWMVEELRPDRWDLMGGAICLVGAAVIIGGPR